MQKRFFERSFRTNAELRSSRRRSALPVSRLLGTGTTDRPVEGQILALLAEGALAPEQIAAHLAADEEDLRRALDELREHGFVERSAIAHHPLDMSTTPAYWRITDAGRARLEQLRTEEQ